MTVQSKIGKLSISVRTFAGRGDSRSHCVARARLIGFQVYLGQSMSVVRKEKDAFLAAKTRAVKQCIRNAEKTWKKMASKITAFQNKKPA